MALNQRRKYYFIIVPISVSFDHYYKAIWVVIFVGVKICVHFCTVCYNFKMQDLRELYIIIYKYIN